MNFKLKTLAIAVGLSSTLTAVPSYALLITSNVQTSASVALNGNVQSDISATGSSASSQVVRSSNAFIGSSTATGDDTGYSYLAAYGPSYTQTSWISSPLDVNVSSTVLHTATITNDSSVAQNIDFNFLINGGSLRLGYSSIYTSGNYINAGYNANIRVNGVTLWNSGAKSELTDGFASNTAQLSFTGTSLNGEANGDNYDWGTYFDTLNLGVLAAGGSLTLEYELNTYVNEHFIDDGYSHTPAATFEDPFDFNAQPLFSADNFVTANAGPDSNVPESSGLALAGLGLAALAFRRRTKKA